MPELPEVETLRRTLERALCGKTVLTATVHRRDMIVAEGDPHGGWSRSTHDRPPTRLTAPMMLAGARIKSLARLGKRMAIIAADGRTLEVYLGMTGQMLIAAPRARLAQRDHVHARWKLDSGERMVFRDPRRFGGLWVYPDEEALQARSWSSVGPDALTIGTRQLRERAHRAARRVKAVLLDQSVIAGVGNIYADESLFRARISPDRMAEDLDREDWAQLARAIRNILAGAIKARGTTLRDYRDARGQRGTGQSILRVYGRAGLPCICCGQTLQGGTIAQRSTSWCSRCQR